MKDLKTYEFGADIGVLRKACDSGFPPAELEPAFRAVVSGIVSMTRETPRSIYLCSPDAHAEARDRFAFLLAKLLREHVPTALLVDCAFLSVGLSGIVPHRDALGFLDLLLYGTSIGVITQETAHGVRVVGAGSFAVTKKCPFVIDAFAAARRYLVNQAKCVIFVGPATDDEENLHPLAGSVDLAVLVRTGERFGVRALDPLEEKIAATENAAAWSVRINTRAALPAADGTRATPEVDPTLVAEVEDLVETIGDRPPSPATRWRASRPEIPPSRRAPGEPPIHPAGRPAEAAEPGRAAARRRAVGSRFIRVVAAAVAIGLVVFVVWWLYLTRSVRERGRESAGSGSRATTAVITTPSVKDSLAAAPSTTPLTSAQTTPQEPVTTSRSRTDSAAADVSTRAREAPAGRGETAASTYAGIHYAETLDEFADRYIIHVSSFKGIEKAREEAFYLSGAGYPVFIYRVDLGSKGMWHRVYVGPYATREDAMEHKINLDGNPRIKSTRISKVPG
jgi:cell division septation protein DedD